MVTALIQNFTLAAIMYCKIFPFNIYGSYIAIQLGIFTAQAYACLLCSEPHCGLLYCNYAKEWQL